MGLLANSTNHLDTLSDSGLPADAKASDNNEAFMVAAVLLPTWPPPCEKCSKPWETVRSLDLI